MKDAPAYDQIIQGLSGMMSITGDARQRAACARAIRSPTRSAASRPPSRSRARWCAATAPGEGAFIDVSMLDSALVGDGLGGLQLPDRRHRAASRTATTTSPRRRRARSARKDGLLNIAANKQEQFEALVARRRPRRPDRPTRASPQRESRKQHRGALTVELEAALSAAPCRGVGSALQQGRRAGRLRPVGAARRWRCRRSRNASCCRPSTTCPASTGRSPSRAPGFKLSGGDPEAAATAAARSGEHTDEVLGAARLQRRRDRRAARGRRV